MKIGFIGLGLMGSPMAHHLLNAGFSLSVYNRTKSKTEEFKRLGLRVFDTPQDIANHVDIIISIVTGPKDIEEIYLGKEGIVHGAKRGLIAIDMSTIGPSAARKIGQELEKYGIDFLDAPVTGGLKGAKEGTLTIFVGGKESVFNKIRDTFLPLGKTILYMGKTGSGQAIKIVNNLITAETLISLSEGLLLAENLGLPKAKIQQALQRVPALSFFMQQRLPDLLNNSFPVRFSLKNMHKDVLLALSEIKKNKNLFKNLTFSRHVGSFYAKALKEGYGDEDFGAVFKIIAKKS